MFRKEDTFLEGGLLKYKSGTKRFYPVNLGFLWSKVVTKVQH